MNRASLSSLPRLLPLRWLASGACVLGLPLLGAVCAQQGGAVPAQPGTVAVSPATMKRPPSAYHPDVVIPAPPAVAPATIQPVSASAPVAVLPAPVQEQPAVKLLPITLDTVLRLAEDQNRQVALARVRLDEACTEKNLAALSWVPNLYVGTSYYRHEGGIQRENGTLINSSFGALFSGVEVGGRFDVREATFLKINAERKVWQQQGELRKVTSETLLEAANTYIDLLHARSGAAVAREMEERYHDLLKWGENTLKAEPGLKFMVEGLRAQIRGHRQAIVKVEQQGDAAAHKLAYLLGLDPCVRLVPVDAKLMPFDLVDPSVPTCQLITQALTSGPGVAELERIIAVVHGGMERMRSPAMMLPVLELRVAEGGIGAGPGGSLAWANRYDMNLQGRWNLNGLLGARDRQRVAQSKLEQVHLTYQDLRGKLTAGVQEAHEAILSGKEQLGMGEDQIRHGQEAHRLSRERLNLGVPGSSISEVLQMVHLMELAKVNQLSIISAYDKAQLRLMIFLGSGYNVHCAAPAVERRLPNPAEKRE